MAPDRICVDHGLTGTNRERPGLREALAACRSGDTLVVTKLDRLARSLPDARAIAGELTTRQVRLNLGGSVYDPSDALGRLMFNVLAMVAEFDLIRLRTREGMKVARAKGHLRGKQPKLTRRQETHLVSLMAGGEHSTADLVQSLVDGARVDDLLALDPAEFAASVATADGVEIKSLRPDPEVTDRSLLETVFTGALAGALVALVTVYPVGFRIMDETNASYEHQGWIAVGLHVIAASISIGAAMFLVWRRFQFRGQVRRTLTVTGSLFALGGVASIAPTMALARSLNYSGDSYVVLLEVSIVVGCCSLGILAARRALARTHHTRVN